MRSKATAEVTSFLDDEIGTKLDKLSRQVARIESRLHTYHEVNMYQYQIFPRVPHIGSNLFLMAISCYMCNNNKTYLM